MKLALALILLVSLLAVFATTTKEGFGMSPGTLTQLQSSHVPNVQPLYHRFKPWDSEAANSFGASNAALINTPMPYLIY